MFGISIITTKRLRSLEADRRMFESKAEYFQNSLCEAHKEIVEDRKGYAKEVLRYETTIKEKNGKINEMSIRIDQQAAEIARLDKELERLTDRDEKGRFVKRETN